MSVMIRLLASTVLVLAALSMPAASGMVMAHVALEHAVSSSESHHPDAHDGHHHADHGSDHSHEFSLSTAFAPARAVDASQLPAPSALPDENRLDSALARALIRPAALSPQVQLPDPKRNSILRL